MTVKNQPRILLPGFHRLGVLYYIDKRRQKVTWYIFGEELKYNLIVSRILGSMELPIIFESYFQNIISV